MFDYHSQYQYYKKYYYSNIAGKPITKVSLGLLLSLGTVCFFAVFALKPTVDIISKLTKEIEQKKSINEKLEAKVEALGKAQFAYAQAEPLIYLLDQALPQAAEFSILERQVRYLALKNNIIINKQSYENFDLVGDMAKKESGGAEKSIRFELSLGGHYQDLRNFLLSLENLTRIISLEQVSFTTEVKIEGIALQLDIQGSAAYLSPESFTKERS